MKKIRTIVACAAIGVVGLPTAAVAASDGDLYLHALNGETHVGGGEYAPSTLDLLVYLELADCESGRRWHIDTGNGFYGGLQWLPSTWRGVGGAGDPADASAAEQIDRARILVTRNGFGPWPGCARHLGLLGGKS